MRYETRPFPGGKWTDPETPERTRAYFRAGWAHTLELLSRETAWLGAHLVVLQLDVTEGDLRRDGMLRANAKVGHPGVIVSFDSEHGPLRYVTDRFDFWQDNVRGIALALQYLRAVDRYGVSSRGEQYTGWRAIPAPVNGFATVDDAVRWMRGKAGFPEGGRLDGAADLWALYRRLARRMHPDAGGDPADWDRLDRARQLLELASQNLLGEDQ
jgi:hypothetical protein